MPQIPKQVNPGELILADFFNEFRAVLIDHETRLGNLEGLSAGSKVEIDAVLPSATFRPGDQITVVGKNFGVPALNRVSIASAVINTFTADSNSTSLTFTVPLMTGIVGSLNTVLIVSNPSGTAQTPVVLLPGQPSVPQGLLQVAESKVSQTTAVTAGQDIFLTYTVTGSTSQDETYNISATVDAGWAAVLVDSSHVPIVPPQIFIPQGAGTGGVNTAFLIKVSVPGGLATGQTGNVNATVTSQLNPKGLNASTNQPFPLTVGSVPGAPQDSIFIQLTNVFAPGSEVALSPPQTGNAAVVPVGSTALASFTIMLKNPDSYKVTLTPPAGWTSAIVSGGSFTTVTPGQSQALKLNLTAVTAGAAATLKIQVASSTLSGQLLQVVQNS